MSVDIYEKRLAGVAIAEIELDQENQEPPFPPWVGREVTAEERLQESNMMSLSLASGAPLTVELLLNLPLSARV
jgi:CYTH domain-containing protein